MVVFSGKDNMAQNISLIVTPRQTLHIMSSKCLAKRTERFTNKTFNYKDTYVMKFTNISFVGAILQTERYNSKLHQHYNYTF